MLGRLAQVIGLQYFNASNSTGVESNQYSVATILRSCGQQYENHIDRSNWCKIWTHDLSQHTTNNKFLYKLIPPSPTKKNKNMERKIRIIETEIVESMMNEWQSIFYERSSTSSTSTSLQAHRGGIHDRRTGQVFSR